MDRGGDCFCLYAPAGGKGDAGSKTGIIAVSGGGVGDGALYLSISKDYGVDAILQKPFRASELIAAVDDVLGRLNLAG